MTQELELISGKDEERAQVLNVDIGRIKDALQSNIEATLVRPAKNDCVLELTPLSLVWNYLSNP